MTTRSEEVLITIKGKDSASNVFSSIDGNAQSMASSIQSAMSSISSGIQNISAVTDNLMQGLTGKSALDNIIGTTSKAETNNVLLGNMLDDAEKNFDSFYEKVDKTTDNSIVSMQELIPALKAFKSATGATDEEMTNVTDSIANFGAAVLAQTGSTDMAQQSMMDLSKGVKGAYASLDQYGITEAALKRTGYWNGDENDVEGFMKAVTEVTGSTKELMETNTGLDALIGKAFSRAGKKMGNEFLPVIKDIKKGFLELDDSLGGNLTASILAVSGGVEAMNTGLWNVTTTVEGFENLSKGAQFLITRIKGVEDAAEGASSALQTMGNVSEIANGASAVGGTASVGADAVKGASKSEKALESGMGALTVADIVKGNKAENKEVSKLLEELKESSKLQEKAQKEMDHISSLKFSTFRSGKVNGLEESIARLNPKGSGAGGRSEVLAKNLRSMLDGTNTIESVIKENESVKKEAGEKLKELTSYEGVFDDDLIKEWEKSDWGLSDAIKDGFNNQKTKISDALTNGKNMITSIPGKFKSSFKSIGDSFKSLGGSFKTSVSSFSDTLKNIKTDGIKGNIHNLDKKLLDVVKGSNEIADTVDVADDAIDGLKDAKNISKGVEEVADVAGAVESTAPALEAGATGAEAAAAGSAGLAASFTSMIVPLLAISAVIIIMIPIVAVIAAEALIFIRLLADFMEALNFDNVNLDGAINGISQVATALAWVGVAMAAMSFASIMTGLAVITGGFTGILGPLDVAVDAIKKAGEKLSAFNNVQINENVASNIQSISTALGAVASAMGALTWTNITTGFSNFIAGALGFGSVTDGLEQAKNDIIEASQKLQEFSSLTPLDDGVAKNIQNVCDSLASVGKAMEALRGIRDGQNWDNLIGDFMSGLFGDGLNIKQALDSVKTDIQNAASALSQWTDLPEIPEGLGDKITKVSDALSSINDAFQTLRGFRDDNVWDDMIGGIFGETDIQSVLDEIITDINEAATKLSNLKIDSDSINDDLIKKIQNVVSALTEITNVSKGLTSLPPMDDFDSGTIDTVVGNVQKAATAIGGLTVGEVSEDTITTIKNVASAITEISGVMTSLTSLPPMDGFDSTVISTAVENVQTAATELSKLNETTFNADSANSVLGTIQTTLENVKTTLSSATGFTDASISIGSQIISGVQSGLSPLSGVIQTEVATAINSAGSQALAGGASLGNTTNNGFKSTLNLHSIMETEMGYVKTAVDNGIAEAKTAAEQGAEEIVEAFKNGVNVGSPGDIARTMEQEMNYTHGFILGAYGMLKNSAYNAARTIVDAFGSPNLGVDSLFFNNGSDYLDTLKTTVSSAPKTDGAKTVIIEIHEGAIPVDARNHTTKEAKALLLTALEGVDNITDIDVDV